MRPHNKPPPCAMGEPLPLFRASFNLLREVIERTRILEWLAGRLARCSNTTRKESQQP